jgi:formylglycine-generating enzyme required for sulfatase activity
MVVIPAGSLQMGAAESDRDAVYWERPQHQVVIARPFALSKYEISFAEYDAFARATQRKLPDDEGWGRDQRPVINVSWQDAQAYANGLSEQTGKRYRLPTEAEWEYAARAGTTTRYSWGDEVGKNNANCRDCGSAWDNKQTAPVGSFAANAFGLHDMAGNVYEWTEDCWHDDYQNAPGDGSAWVTGKCELRVMRGGSWGYTSGGLRASSRVRNDPVLRWLNLGFRLARTLD